MALDDELVNKEKSLKEYIARYDRLAVAFSGGADSSYLLSVAAGILGDGAVALTVSSPLATSGEIGEASESAAGIGVELEVIEAGWDFIETFGHNPPDRCYICKKSLFSMIIERAGEIGIRTVIEASNFEDRDDYRPGIRALRELGVLSPLMELGFKKREIRELSKARGLATWDRPARACLASRIPYDEAITPDKLEQIGQGEELLASLGFRSCRLRHHGSLARIETSRDEIARLLDAPVRAEVLGRLKELGFKYVTVDLEGYRTGSMNEVLDIK